MKIINKKNIKEIIIYGLVGLSTTAVNIMVYQVFLIANTDYKIANLIALLLSKTYGYIANKNIVFRSHCSSVKELFKELIKFIFARGLTGLIDYVGLIVAVEILLLDKVISKYAIQLIVIFLNYIFGKFLVFSGEKMK